MSKAPIIQTALVSLISFSICTIMIYGHNVYAAIGWFLSGIGFSFLAISEYINQNEK